MPTLTYTPLANITLSSSATSITFSSISQSYRDLILVISQPSNAVSQPAIHFNNTTSAGNYPGVYMSGNGTTASSGTQNEDRIYAAENGYMITTCNIMDYSATDKHKTVLSRGNSASGATSATASRWASTSAITTINVTGGTYVANTVMALYGIAA